MLKKSLNNEGTVPLSSIVASMEIEDKLMTKEVKNVFNSLSALYKAIEKKMTSLHSPGFRENIHLAIIEEMMRIRHTYKLFNGTNTFNDLYAAMKMKKSRWGLSP